jgi:hypothetical protein
MKTGAKVRGALKETAITAANVECRTRLRKATARQAPNVQHSIQAFAGEKHDARMWQ